MLAFPPVMGHGEPLLVFPDQEKSSRLRADSVSWEQGGVTCQGTVTPSLQGEHWRLALGFSICTAISVCSPKRSLWV